MEGDRSCPVTLPSVVQEDDAQIVLPEVPWAKIKGNTQGFCPSSGLVTTVLFNHFNEVPEQRGMTEVSAHQLLSVAFSTKSYILDVPVSGAKMDLEGFLQARLQVQGVGHTNGVDWTNS